MLEKVYMLSEGVGQMLHDWSRWCRFLDTVLGIGYNSTCSQIPDAIEIRISTEQTWASV